jgi:hypothetical protein
LEHFSDWPQDVPGPWPSKWDEIDIARFCEQWEMSETDSLALWERCLMDVGFRRELLRTIRGGSSVRTC